MPIAALLLLAGCDYNEKNFDGLDEMTQPTNVESIDYALTNADYAAVANNKTNKALAIGKSKEDSTALANLKTTLQFTATITPDEYLPAFLAEKYYTASATSVVRVTFNYQGGTSELLKPYTAIPTLSLEKNEDYLPFYGEGYYAPYLNTTSVQQIGSKLLTLKYPNAKNKELVMVAYNYNESAVPQQIETPVVNYDFNTLPVGDLTFLSGWYLKAPSAKPWTVGSYKGNSYPQYSAKDTKEVSEAWMVTPGVSIVGTDKKLGFDITIGYWNADCLSIFISTDFDGKDVSKATWVDITSAYAPPVSEKPEGKYGKAVHTELSLADYAGKKIRVAFKYVGDGANKKTTTYQIDNVVVGKDIPNPVVTTPQFKLFVYDSKTKWSEYDNKPGIQAYCPTFSDYTLMGDPGDNMYFSTTVRPENYLPEYLSRQGNYPQNGATVAVIYRFYNLNKKIDAQARAYVYSSERSRWEMGTETRQYAFDGGAWVYDPSLTITLGGKGDKAASAFYQIITDWVKANKGAEYVTSFGNNDYYYGGSAYNNNFDFRPSAWKGHSATAYGDMSDDDLKKLMMKRLPEAFVPALEAQYPKAAPAEGVNVIYTVKFAIYDGTNTIQWTIGYQVTTVGKFEYVKDSLKEVK